MEKIEEAVSKENKSIILESLTVISEFHDTLHVDVDFCFLFLIRDKG
jgi:hypothetical protein